MPSLMLEYYEPTFNRLHSTKGVEIGAALLGAALPLRSRYFKTYCVGDVLSGPTAHEILRGYLDRREDSETFATYVARADEAWLL